MLIDFRQMLFGDQPMSYMFPTFTITNLLKYPKVIIGTFKCKKHWLQMNSDTIGISQFFKLMFRIPKI